MKKLVAFKMEEELAEMLSVVASFKGRTNSSIVEELVRDFVVKNKAEIHESINKFWNQNNFDFVK